MKKSIVILFITAAILGSVSGYLVSSRDAHAAGMPVIDISAIGTAILNMAKEVAQWALEEASRVIRDQVVKKIVDDLTDQIISSIDNGGAPLFVQNPLGALQRQGDIAFDTFNTYLGSQTGIDLCSPFQAQLQVYFQTTYQKQAKYGVPARCTYEQFQQAIRRSNPIERGGWVTFQQAFVPSNNFFGASLLVDQAYMSEVSKKVDQTSNAMNRNLGFSDVKKCTRWMDPISGQLISRESADNKATDQCLATLQGGDDETVRACVQNLMDGWCDRWETVTPGSVVAEAATKGVLKDFEYAANVQSVISALINSVLSKVFKSKDNQTSGLLAGHSNISGLNHDYSSYVGTTFADKVKKIKNELSKIARSYYDISAYLKELKQKVAPGPGSSIISVRSLVLAAIQKCSQSVSGWYGTPKWGYVKYFPQDGFGVNAYLGDLVEYPILSPVPYPQAPGFPEHEGYLNQVARATNDALFDLNGSTSTSLIFSTTTQLGGKRGEIQEAIDRVNLIDVNATDTEYIASSTLLMNKILGAQSTKFSEFSGTYADIISGALTGNMVGFGPGTAGEQGLIGILNKISAALIWHKESTSPMFNDLLNKNGFYSCYKGGGGIILPGFGG